MRDRLPPLFTLQAFEASARLGNFTRAANELNLTPGAVSRQIRQLEQWCGQTLFERHGGAMRLTTEGQELLERLGGPLAALHDAVYPSPEEAHPILQIATLGSLARLWLVPRLGDFIARSPHVRVTVQTDYALVRPPPRVAMVALRHGLASDGGELLFEDRLVAVAMPTLALRLGTDPAAWPSELILSHVGADAPSWFAGVGSHPVAAGPSCNDAGITIDMALAGLGVAVSRLSLVLPLLASGQLVMAHPLVIPSTRSNRLVVRDDSSNLPVVTQFRAWIRHHAAQTRAELLAFDSEGSRRR